MFQNTFNGIKEQIEKYPQLLDADEGRIENAFHEGKITEDERKVLLILLLEIEYQKLPFSGDFISISDFDEIPPNIAKLEKKVMKLFTDFNLKNSVGYFHSILFFRYLKLKRQSNRIKLDHVIVIHAYVMFTFFANGYDPAKINEELESKPTDYTLRIAKLLNEALEFFPNYEGVVYRTIRKEDWSEFGTWETLAARLEKEYRIGLIFRTRRFLSTSKSTVWLRYPVRYQIISKTGKNIEGIGREREEEVLFKTETEFKVTNFVRDERQKYVMIYLEEI